MKRLALGLCICLISVGAMMAQRTTRPKLKLDTAEAGMAVGDTIRFDSAKVIASGYEKALRSTSETVFLTNTTDFGLAQVHLVIEYFDMKGRQLHQREITIKIDLPPGQTRLVRFTSWDKHKVWYYYLTDPTRTKSQATPYKVSIVVKWGIKDFTSP